MTPEIGSFIRASFPSVWALELLLFLRARPDEAFASDELVTRLRGSALIVDVSVQSLIAAGLAAADGDGRYRYAPSSPAADRLAEAVDEAYRARPDAVRRLIAAGPGDKFQALADAFRLRRDP